MLRLLVIVPAAVLALHGLGAVLLPERAGGLLAAGGIGAGILWLLALGWWLSERGGKED